MAFNSPEVQNSPLLESSIRVLEEEKTHARRYLKRRNAEDLAPALGLEEPQDVEG